MQSKVKQKDKNRVLRSLLNDPGIIVSLGVHDAFSALIAQHAGFNLLFLGGFGVSASRFGLPDLNFLNLSDMELAVQQITRQLSIPLIADGDTGHGNLPHVRQTVERLAAAGASGILLEDQLFPKKCGHFHQKQIITKEEMLGKIEVAVDSRPDEDFVIIARTDARALNGLEDAIDRVNAYCELGADVAFIEAPESRAELERIADNVPYPLFANMLVGGKTPILSVSDLERLGYKIAVSPIETLMVCGSAMQSMMEALKQTGQLTHHLEDKMSFDTLKDILNLDGLLNTQTGHQRVQ
ncbi:MAG: isocitrate lyase/PEP mutase family protein [Verrucomicrobia bacterium]|nr:isocitrate lyase/PEP mutase family protein [Verrucomicrobiota bacterium]MBT6240004.1 isocitrate lyase/PEP mutase family protein [Verrucomicrobiota bacterium]MBT7537354.1 isocitrate lyase/PEP mutase family protein [Verrucomicrobiota bacterium]